MCNLSTYNVLVCSKACHDAATTEEDGLHHEVDALKDLYNISPSGGPPKILPSAILVYRIIVAGAAAANQDLWNEMMGMVGQDGSSDMEEDEAHHQQAVVMTVHALLRCNGKYKQEIRTRLQSITVPDVVRVLTKMKLNAFTICEETPSSSAALSEAIGFGLFQTAYRINHSCRPNAQQSFVFQKGSTPKLQITVYRPVPVGDEISLSYIDTGKSREERQYELKKNYKFFCSCSRCKEDEP